ncbi:MAG: ankyrin repeat domain-containing protein [Planctomycetota bacterium]|nr:ankyrin repeat domain-containing protein [Planctomycetota bacterium]
MRALPLLILFLALGLVTSIAIAWSATIFNTGAGQTHTIASNGWVGRLQRGPARIEIGATADANRLIPKLREDDDFTEIPRWSRLQKPPDSVDVRAEEFACGWPLPCLRYLRRTDGEILLPDLDFASRGALEGDNPLTVIGIGRPGVRFLPIDPIWLHLLVNALLLGAAWFILLRIHYPWRFVRAMGRVRRGLCPSCRYDLRYITSARCPECGRARRHRPAFITRELINISCALIVALGLIEAGFGMTFSAHPLYDPIHRAAYRGDLATVQREIEGGADVDRPVPAGREPYGATPLWLAAAGGHPETARWLVDAGADLAVRNAAFGAALDMAALRAAPEVVRLLLEAGADVNAGDNVGATPLHRAASGGDRAVVALLIEYGADVNAQTIVPFEPLHLAATAGHTAVAELLLEAGARTDTREQTRRTPLACAVWRRHPDTAEMLLRHGAAIDERALIDAVATGDVEPVELLARYGADLTARVYAARTLLFYASRDPEARPVWELLLAHGVNINAHPRGRTVLMIAARRGSTEFVEFLLAHGADPMMEDDRGRTALDYARGDRRAIIERAMEEGSDE